jgi:16S rRNA processing protein RimM
MTRPMQNNVPPRLILLGRIGAAHGIKGDVSIRTFTGDPEAIGSYGPLTDKTGAKSFKVRVVRVNPKGGVIARVQGADDRNAAEALNGTELYVDRARLPKPREGEFYHADLIGLKAVAPDSGDIGTIVAVENFGAGDLLEIQRTGSHETEFVPFTNACVPEIDLAAGRAVVIMPVMTGDQELDGRDE